MPVRGGRAHPSNFRCFAQTELAGARMVEDFAGRFQQGRSQVAVMVTLLRRTGGFGHGDQMLTVITLDVICAYIKGSALENSAPGQEFVMPPTVLITGVSTGIGHAAVLAFLKRGYRVFGTVRQPSEAQALAL